MKLNKPEKSLIMKLDKRQIFIKKKIDESTGQNLKRNI